MTFELIELELIFVGSTTDASLIDVMSSNSTMCLLFDELTVQGLISHLLLRVHLLVSISLILYITRQISLLVISTSLRSPFELILNLLLLFFV